VVLAKTQDDVILNLDFNIQSVMKLRPKHETGTTETVNNRPISGTYTGECETL